MSWECIGPEAVLMGWRFFIGVFVFVLFMSLAKTDSGEFLNSHKDRYDK